MTDLCMQLPPNIADRVRYPATIVEEVRQLARTAHDAQIAAQLNREGHRSAKGKPYTTKIIQWIRWRYQIPPARLNKPEELTIREVAQRFSVSTDVVRYWIEHGGIRTRQLDAGSPHWITLSQDDEQKLRDWVSNSKRIQAGKASPSVTGGSAL